MSIFTAALALLMLPTGPLTYQTDDFVLTFPAGWQRALVQDAEVPHVSFTREIDGQQVGLILMKAEGTTAEETWRQGQRSGSWQARGSRKIQLDGQPAYELDFTAKDDDREAYNALVLADRHEHMYMLDLEFEQGPAVPAQFLKDFESIKQGLRWL